MKLGDRMKQYEYVTRTYLPCRMPVIIRIDGKAFHTFTKSFIKPYDLFLSKCMSETTQALVSQIEGCVFGYTESDEISLLLRNNQTLETNAWFDNNISKILSVSTSIATLAFNRAFSNGVEELTSAWDWHKLHLKGIYGEALNENVLNAWKRSANKGALFDARVFVLPEEEVTNYFLWRQEDASKNSIQMLAQSIYPHKELQGIHTGDLQNKMFTENGINWNDVPVRFKRGIACYRQPVVVDTPNGQTTRNKVVEDLNIPIFSDDRDFVERWLK